MYKVLIVGQSRVNGQGRPHFIAETVSTLEDAARSLKLSRFDVIAVEDGVDLSELGVLPIQLVALLLVKAPVHSSFHEKTHVVALGEGPFVDELVRVLKHEILEKVGTIQLTASRIQKMMDTRLASM